MKEVKNFIATGVLLIFAWASIQAQCVTGDCVNGYGEMKYPNGDMYKGSFENQQRNGQGIYTYNNSEVFSGIFKDDEKVYGIYTFVNGNEYTGSFENNKPNGYGTIKRKDGTSWDGEWKDGKPYWGGDISESGKSIVLSSSLIKGSGSSATKSRKASAPRIFSVIVGIADYEGTLSDLNYCDDDARLFYRHLQLAMSKEMAAGKAVLLLDDEATNRNILNAMQNVFSQSTENDFIIFYFSGHGGPGYFCPTDYTHQQLGHELVKNKFKNAKARYRVCIADACFSGSIGSVDNAYTVPLATQQLNDARLAVIMSSKPYQTSAETYSLKQGVFSYYLINGLKGAADLNRDTYITTGELFLYTKNAVSRRSNGSQIPVVYGKNLDQIPLARIKR